MLSSQMWRNPSCLHAWKHPHAKEEKICKEELEAYYKEDIFSDVDPLMFWNSSLKEYPCLARLAQHVLAVPATSGAIERTFSQAGKILRPDRSRLLPKNLETLLFLKTNSQLLWLVDFETRYSLTDHVAGTWHKSWNYSSKLPLSLHLYYMSD